MADIESTFQIPAFLDDFRLMKCDENLGSCSRSEVSFLDFAQVLLERIEDPVRSAPLPKKSNREREFDESDWSWKEKFIVDIPQIFKIFDIKTLDPEHPQILNCALIHLDSGTIEKPKMSECSGAEIENPTDRQLSAALIHRLIFPLLTACLDCDSLFPSSEALVRSHRSYYSTPFDKAIYIPLVGIEYIPDSMKFISSDLSIIETSAAWKNNYKIIFDFPSFSRIDAHDLSSAKFAIKFKYSSAKAETTLPFDLITSIRIVANSEIGGLVVIDDPGGPKLKTLGCSWFPAEEMQIYTRFPESLNITEGEAAQMLLVFQKIQDLREDGRLQLLSFGIRRFNLAFGRQFEEDSFIDLVIASEAILLHGLKDELSYRYLIRGMTLLAGRFDSNHAQQMFKLAYQIRSGLVHGTMSSRPAEPGFKELAKALKKGGASNFESCRNDFRKIVCDILSITITSLNSETSLPELLCAIDQETAKRISSI